MDTQELYDHTLRMRQLTLALTDDIDNKNGLIEPDRMLLAASFQELIDICRTAQTRIREQPTLKS